MFAPRANAPASRAPIGARAETAIASTTHKIAPAAATTRASRVLFSTPGRSGSASNAAAVHGEKDEPSRNVPLASASAAASAPRPSATARIDAGVASATNARAASNTAPRLASAARDAFDGCGIFDGDSFDGDSSDPSAAAAAAAAAAVVSSRTSASAAVRLSARYDAAAAWMDGESPSDASDAATTTPV